MTKEQEDAVYDANWRRLWYFVTLLTKKDIVAEDITVHVLNDFFKSDFLITGPEETKWHLYKKVQEAVHAYFIDLLGVDLNTEDHYLNTILDVEFTEVMHEFYKDDIKKIPVNASKEERHNAILQIVRKAAHK